MRGSVRAKGVGRWELRVPTGRDAAGRRTTRSKTVDAANETAAKRALARFVAELDAADAAGQVTMARIFDAWYVHTAPHRTARSNDTVRANIDLHLVPHMGDWPAVTVTVGMLEQAYQKIRVEGAGRRGRKGLSDRSIRHLHYIVAPSLRLAVRWGWIETNPADLVELGPLEQRNVRPPTPADVIRLLDAAPPDLRAFLWLSAVIGARCAEIAALRWGDIDFLRATISINTALTVPKSGLAVKQPKTDRSRRPIGVDFDTLRVLEELRARNLANGADDGPDRYIFPDLRRHRAATRPLSPRTWSTRFQTLKEQLGIDCQLRDFRHFTATTLLRDGVPVAAVSAMLGHSLPSITQNVYGFWAGEGSNPAMAASLAKRLQPAPTELPALD